MTPEQILQIAQISVSLVTLGGVAFSIGRLYGRIDHLTIGQEEIKKALFGADGNDGAYLRRSEASLLQESFARRLDEFSDRIGRIEGQ